VGNVPSHLTEEELRAAFERHGRVESLRLVSQRGHRFAFANYVSVDEAIRAKAYLSRQTMWRSAISFARRESFCGAPPPRHMHGSSTSSSGSPPPAPAGSSAAAAQYGAGSSGYGSDHSASSSEGSRQQQQQQWSTTIGRGGESPLQQHPLLAHQQQLRAQVVCPSPSPLPPLHGQHHYSQQQQLQSIASGNGGSSSSSSCVVVPAAGSYSMASPLAHSASLSALGSSSSSVARVLERAGSLGSLSDSCCYEGGDSCVNDLQQQQAQQQQQQYPALMASPVLATLTSDHFVPTQAWPAQLHRDWPFVEAVAEQLRQVGGSTTISKLRGLLKGRLGSALTIKSVPLKALLAAYQSLFVLMGNRVALAAACCGPAPASAAAAVMDTSITINMSSHSSSSYMNSSSNNSSSNSSGAVGDPSSSLQQFVVRASA
jgi:RNA recognition motif. (a.k.a. RRM, RBD, or RNP domain)